MFQWECLLLILLAYLVFN